MLKISVNPDGLTTGQMLDLMELQAEMQTDNSAKALRGMVTILQTAITGIEYDGQARESLLEIPFRQLRTAIEQVMQNLNGTDPN